MKVGIAAPGRCALCTRGWLSGGRRREIRWDPCQPLIAVRATPSTSQGCAVRHSRNVVVAVAAIALLAAVGVIATRLPGSEDTSAPGVLDRFVLTMSDLPRGYARSEGVTSAEGCSDPAFDRAETRRLRARGVVGCTLEKYRREEVDGYRGGLVYLRGYLFEDVRHASAALRELRREYFAGASGGPVVSKHSLPAPALGDQAPRGVALSLRGLGPTVAYWWRRDKVVEAIVVAGRFGDRDRHAVLALARRIDARATHRYKTLSTTASLAACAISSATAPGCET